MMKQSRKKGKIKSFVIHMHFKCKYKMPAKEVRRFIIPMNNNIANAFLCTERQMNDTCMNLMDITVYFYIDI